MKKHPASQSVTKAESNVKTGIAGTALTGTGIAGTIAAALLLGASCGVAHAQLKGRTLPVGPPSAVSPAPISPAAAPDVPPPAPKLPVMPPRPQLAPVTPVPAPSEAPQLAPAPVSTPDTSPLTGLHLSSSVNVLVLGLDDADLRQTKSNWQAPGAPAPASADNSLASPQVVAGNGGNASMLEKQLNPDPIDVNDRPPGQGQMIAAPLRRVLVEAGAGDVLNTPLDGPSMVRAVNAARLSPRVLETARNTMRRIEEIVQSSSSAGTPVEIPAALQQDAFTAFTRIGQALGYRAVIAVAAPGAASPGAPQGLLLLVDCQQQNGDIIPLSISGQPNALQTTDNLAAMAGAFVLPRLSAWPAADSGVIQTQTAKYLQQAKEAAAKNDLLTAQDDINQVVGLQPNNASAYVTLGDLLQKTAPQAAVAAYNHALDINPNNGALWSKLALVSTYGDSPNWPVALDAAQHALATGYDSALLRTVMATAEFGRAALLSKGGQDEDADDAKVKAQDYLDRAMKLAPTDPTVNADVSKLIAGNLISAQRFNEAAGMLDLVVRKYPNDLELQRVYATALTGADNRAEDAFVAWAAVWKLEGDNEVPMDAATYTSVANGFDKHVFNLARAASMLTSSAAAGTIPTSTALPQVQLYSDQLKSAMDALRLLRPPAGRLTTQVQVARLIAGDLFSQAVASYLLYLQNGDKDVLAQGGKMHYQAIDRLNSARKAS